MFRSIDAIEFKNDDEKVKRDNKKKLVSNFKKCEIENVTCFKYVLVNPKRSLFCPSSMVYFILTQK